MSLGSRKVRNEYGKQKASMNLSSFQNKNGIAPSSASAPAPKNKCNGQNSQNFRTRPAQSQGSVAQRGSWTPACARCGETYQDKCLYGQTGFFEYG